MAMASAPEATGAPAWFPVLRFSAKSLAVTPTCACVTADSDGFMDAGADPPEPVAEVSASGDNAMNDCESEMPGVPRLGAAAVVDIGSLTADCLLGSGKLGLTGSRLASGRGDVGAVLWFGRFGEGVTAVDAGGLAGALVICSGRSC